MNTNNSDSTKVVMKQRMIAGKMFTLFLEKYYCDKDTTRTVVFGSLVVDFEKRTGYKINRSYYRTMYDAGCLVFDPASSTLKAECRSEIVLDREVLENNPDIFGRV